MNREHVDVAARIQVAPCWSNIGRATVALTVHLTAIAHPGKKVVNDHGAREGSLLVYVNNELVWKGPCYTHPDHPAVQGLTFALGGVSESQCALIDNVRVTSLEAPAGERSPVVVPEQIARSQTPRARPTLDPRERKKLAEVRSRACSE